jgi:predicted amidohydrolase YtcJ
LKFKKIWILIVVCAFTISGCQKSTLKADTIYLNTVIWTGNESKPEAQAMAISGDSILAIGSEKEIQPLKGNKTVVVDLNGAFITPGFIDSHVHLMMGGNSLLSVQLRDAKTQEEFKRRISIYAINLNPGDWGLVGNWDRTLWGGELPRKEWIDSTTQENPVVIYRLDGHMVLANSLALKIAGIDKDTPDINGGEIVRDQNGNPTGILKDNAMNVLLDKIPPMSPQLKENSMRVAMDYLLANGVTSVHDVDSLGTYEVAKKLKDAGELNIRIYTVNPLNHWKKRFGIIKEDDKWLKTGGLKGFVDGSLGSHTAAFNEPYIDKPEDSGFFINTEENLSKWIREADDAELQILVHAIGDKANHSILNIFEELVHKNGKKDRRLRIEHAQHLSPKDIKRFAELSIIVSVQPYHAIDDGRWAEELIGPERIKTTYPFNSLFKSDAKVVFGSDWPVAPATPLDGIYAAVTRQTLDGANPDGWVPEEKISVEQALLAYTKNAAFASFEESRKGTLEPGKLADFVVINKNIMKVKPEEIKDLTILKTFVGGKKMFDNTSI